MSTYNVAAHTITAPATGHVLRLSFGTQAQNTEIVRDAVAALAAAGAEGGELVLLNGPASLPVAVAIGHGVAHKYGALGCFDPKLNGYVVSVSHDPRWAAGDLIPASTVTEA